MKTLIAQIQAVNPDAAVTVTDGSGKAVSDSALVSTGQLLTIQDAAGTYAYTCVVYGDANGDGRIAATDLLAVKKHILGVRTLTGAYARGRSALRQQDRRHLAAGHQETHPGHRAHRAEMKSRCFMKHFRKFSLSLLLTGAMLLCLVQTSFADGISVSAGQGSVSVGKTVAFSITVPSGSEA